MSTPRSRPPARKALAAALLLALASGNASADGHIWVTHGGDPDPADSTTCSLRQAINLASTAVPNTGACNGRDGSRNTIEMAPWLAHSHIVLQHGQLSVPLPPFNGLTVRGHGVVIDANQASRVLDVSSTAEVQPVALALEDVTLTGGDARTGSNDGNTGRGGGVLHRGTSELRLIRSRVTGNTATTGGGIFTLSPTNTVPSRSYLILNDSRVDDNTADRGGGLALVNPLAHVVRSTISGNHSEQSGAGVWLAKDQDLEPFRIRMSLWNSTISGNTVIDHGPGSGFYYPGAAIYSIGVPMDVVNTTISGNRGAGGAVATVFGDVTFTNSILSGNLFHTSPMAINPDFFHYYAGGAPDISASRSVLGAGTGGYFSASGNTFTDTPLLGALADNGGFTQSMLPFAGSPAIDFGDAAACGGPTSPRYDNVHNTDQRSVTRPQGAQCDAGAVEARQGAFTIAANAAGAGRIDALPLPTGTGSSGGIANCTSAGGATCSATFVDENDISTLTFTATPATGWHLAGWSGDCGASTLDASASLVIDDDRSCNATFEIDTHTIGGIVQGLVGSGLVLQLGGANDLPIAVDGHFEFPVTLDYGTPYSVTVAAQPAAPAQTCFIPHGSGVADHDVDDIAVICADEPIPVEVSVAIDDGAAFALPDDTPTYAISVRNDGDATAYNVELATSVVPASALEGFSWACTGVCSPAGGTGDVALTLDLPAKSQATVQLHGNVAALAGATLDVAA